MRERHAEAQQAGSTRGLGHAIGECRALSGRKNPREEDGLSRKERAIAAGMGACEIRR